MDTWWQRPAYIAALAGLIAALAVATIAGNTVINGNRLDSQGDVLEAIERNQAGVDELVAFVREIQEQPAGTETDDAVRVVVDLLCASSDPARQDACAELGENE